MIIRQTRNGDTLTLAPEGRLDTVSSPELDALLDHVDPSVSGLVLDLEKTEYISSAGIRVVLKAHQKMEERNGLVIRNANSVVMDIFGLTGLTDLLCFE